MFLNVEQHLWIIYDHDARVGHHLNPLVCHSSHNDLLRSYCALFWKLEIQFGWRCGFESSRAHYWWTSGFLEGRCTDKGRKERALLEKYERMRKQDWARRCLTPQGRQAIPWKEGGGHQEEEKEGVSDHCAICCSLYPSKDFLPRVSSSPGCTVRLSQWLGCLEKTMGSAFQLKQILKALTAGGCQQTALLAAK